MTEVILIQGPRHLTASLAEGVRNQYVKDKTLNWKTPKEIRIVNAEAANKILVMRNYVNIVKTTRLRAADFADHCDDLVVYAVAHAKKGEPLKPKNEPRSELNSEAVTHTFEDIRRALNKKVAEHRTYIRDVMRKTYGVSSVSSLRPSQYKAFICFLNSLA